MDCGSVLEDEEVSQFKLTTKPLVFMKRKILLPNNNFGALLMLALILLIIVVPFAVTLWAVWLVAPWWVALPCSFLVSLITFVVLVRFKD